jgi:hypothetical protein
MYPPKHKISHNKKLGGGVITLQLKKLGNLDRYLDTFHLIGVFIRRGPEPNSAAVGTT